MTATYDLIASSVLTVGTGTITFSSIPATYRDLVLVTVTSASINLDEQYRFNSDSGTNYNWNQMLGDGTNIISNTTTSETLFFLGTGNSGLTFHQIQIMDYSATDRHKTFLAREGRGNGFTKAVVGRWASTSAINSITINNNGGPTNFAVGSTFYLYGIVS